MKRWSGNIRACRCWVTTVTGGVFGQTDDLEDGSVFTFGELNVRVRHVPGHHRFDRLFCAERSLYRRHALHWRLWSTLRGNAIDVVRKSVSVKTILSPRKTDCGLVTSTPKVTYDLPKLRSRKMKRSGKHLKGVSPSGHDSRELGR